LNWIARQPWSDGKIGMIGGSYLGIVQWKAALLDNPHLKAIFPVVSGYDDYRDRFYSTGGAVKLGNRLEWMSENLKVPVTSRISASLCCTCRYARRMWRPPAGCRKCTRRRWTIRRSIRSGVPSAPKSRFRRCASRVFGGGWYDNYAQSDLEAYAALHKTSGLNRILVGPWPHNMSYKFEGVDFGPQASVPMRSLQLEWFDQWLMGKDTPLVSKPPVEIFVMGANRWREAREWPLAQARVRNLYLDGSGRANTLEGDGALSDRPARHASQDHYEFDPRDPAPTRGGAVCCNPRCFRGGRGPAPGGAARGRAGIHQPAPEGRRGSHRPVKVVLYVRPAPKIRTSRPSWWTCFRTATRATLRTAFCACGTATPWRSQCWRKPAKSTWCRWTRA